MTDALLKRLAAIRLLAFDVDGVLTDGGIILGNDEEMKRFNVKDGAGIALAHKAGLLVAFVTARDSDCVARRGNELHVEDVMQGAKDKRGALERLAKKHDITIDEILYMGDDLPDLAALEFAGVSAAPADAVPEIRAAVDIMTANNGGSGAVRELCEVVLRAQGKWDGLVESYRAKSQELKH